MTQDSHSVEQLKSLLVDDLQGQCPDKYLSLMSSGCESFLSGDMGSAEAAFKQSHSQNSSLPQAWLGQSLCYIAKCSEQDFGEARLNSLRAVSEFCSRTSEEGAAIGREIVEGAIVTRSMEIVGELGSVAEGYIGQAEQLDKKAGNANMLGVAGAFVGMRSHSKSIKMVGYGAATASAFASSGMKGEAKQHRALAHGIYSYSMDILRVAIPEIESLAERRDDRGASSNLIHIWLRLYAGMALAYEKMFSTVKSSGMNGGAIGASPALSKYIEDITSKIRKTVYRHIGLGALSVLFFLFLAFLVDQGSTIPDWVLFGGVILSIFGFGISLEVNVGNLRKVLRGRLECMGFEDITGVAATIEPTHSGNMPDHDAREDISPSVAHGPNANTQFEVDRPESEHPDPDCIMCGRSDDSPPYWNAGDSPWYVCEMHTQKTYAANKCIVCDGSISTFSRYKGIVIILGNVLYEGNAHKGCISGLEDNLGDRNYIQELVAKFSP